MHEKEIQFMAEDSLNIAIKHIQDQLKQTDGGFAGIYFCGDKWDQLMEIMQSYIRAEIQEGQTINPLFTKPITTEEQARDFYYQLESLGLLFHPEDDPAQIVNKNGRVFTDLEAQALRERVEEIYCVMLDPCEYILTLDPYRIAEER